MNHVAHLTYSAFCGEIGDFLIKPNTQVAYVPGSFWDSQTPQFAGTRRLGSGEVLPFPGDATSRRVHELGRWLTPVPSTEVKDQIRTERRVGDLARSPPKTTLFYHTWRVAGNDQTGRRTPFTPARRLQSGGRRGCASRRRRPRRRG